MAIVPITTCARLLGIHPKTLHHWLKEADLPLAVHPTDARVKCLAEEHLQEVATRHGRPLPALPAASGLSGDAALEKGELPAQALPFPEAELDPPTALMSVSCVAQADLAQKLSCLETKIVTLQEQLAGLALALLHERERTVEQRITTLEALVHSTLGKPVRAEPQTHEAAGASCWERRLHPAEQQARSRLPALIEYSAHGTYVIISSQEGELHLAPDSAEWFAWLATLPSFRFVGQQGRFTAYRREHFSRSWRAHRVIHQQHYRQPLGVTDQLTIARLEQAAATLQSRVASL